MHATRAFTSGADRYGRLFGRTAASCRPWSASTRLLSRLAGTVSARFVGHVVRGISTRKRGSTAVGLFAGGWVVSQLWVFWLAPIVGGAAGAPSIVRSSRADAPPWSSGSRGTRSPRGCDRQGFHDGCAD